MVHEPTHHTSGTGPPPSPPGPVTPAPGPRPTPEQLVAHYGLEPLPREGGRFRRLWAGPERPDGRPEGSAIVMLLTDAPDDFSALHRLAHDEIWHFHLGDPLEILLLAPDGTSRTAVLGPDVLAGQSVQLTVPARTWMGARVATGGAWTLFGCTMAPGFDFRDYEHGVAADLIARYPHEAARIAALTR
ncbi:cupin domain-containing protein [Streptomyces pactum]|uniref:Cupin domain-containing protein n=1 Tax=Streptomyces pactum TaxID=68249 RepID=A0ABS0NML0_9ACTN|nr:cupin domain-containing protein [Streptomyces pactum]MBH5336304.1 cupin domain-containing protein [Streptomyces pactum]